VAGRVIYVTQQANATLVDYAKLESEASDCCRLSEVTNLGKLGGLRLALKTERGRFAADHARTWDPSFARQFFMSNEYDGKRLPLTAAPKPSFVMAITSLDYRIDLGTSPSREGRNGRGSPTDRSG
jgi:hypothetical protein